MFAAAVCRSNIAHVIDSDIPNAILGKPELDAKTNILLLFSKLVIQRTKITNKGAHLTFRNSVRTLYQNRRISNYSRLADITRPKRRDRLCKKCACAS